jgi:CubicO group peptidase (beta-lactamase class C family)
VPATNDNVYPIASITKVLTATSTFLLIQDGKLRLDEPIGELLSGIPKEWNRVTVLNRLSQSSGIQNIPNIYDKFDYPLSEEAALAEASSQSLVYEPGEKSAYNQTEFILLKKIIEKISGVSYPEFLKQRIFSPLGITSAFFGDSRDVVPHFVTVYTRALPAADRLHSEPIVPFVNNPDDPLFHSMLLFASNTYGGDGLKYDSPRLSEGRLCAYSCAPRISSHR